jgi:GH25 family lysozyme M1 (1,4-beta-N-acetylmuramidase)
MIYGTDVASYQPGEFALSGGGKKYEFVFIKATQGINYVNPDFKAQRAWAIKNGLRVGYYHFLEAGNPTAQAKYFHDFLHRNGYLRPGDMIACDWESYSSSGKTFNATNADKDTFVKNCVSAFPESKVVLYCNTTQWKTRDTTSYCGDGLWIADPSSPDGKPNIKHPWTFQQTAITGNQDVNVGNFSDRAALNKWADAKRKIPAESKTYDVKVGDTIRIGGSVLKVTEVK